MRVTIDFNDQAIFGTAEVNDERPKRLLPAKFQASDASFSQRIPQNPLGVSRSSTMLSCCLTCT
jgi:hypothetical protein